MISPSQRPLPDNTQHSQDTNIQALGGIRTHDRSRRVAVDLRLRPRGHWDRLIRTLPVLFSLTEGFNFKWNALQLQDDLGDICKKVVILRNLNHCPWDSKEEKSRTVIKFRHSGLSQTTDWNTRSLCYEARMWTQCDKDKRIKQVVEIGTVNTIGW